MAWLRASWDKKTYDIRRVLRPVSRIRDYIRHQLRRAHRWVRVNQCYEEPPAKILACKASTEPFPDSRCSAGGYHWVCKKQAEIRRLQAEAAGGLVVDGLAAFADYIESGNRKAVRWINETLAELGRGATRLSEKANQAADCVRDRELASPFETPSLAALSRRIALGQLTAEQFAHVLLYGGLSDDARAGLLSWAKAHQSDFLERVTGVLGDLDFAVRKPNGNQLTDYVLGLPPERAGYLLAFGSSDFDPRSYHGALAILQRDHPQAWAKIQPVYHGYLVALSYARERAGDGPQPLVRSASERLLRHHRGIFLAQASALQEALFRRYAEGGGVLEEVNLFVASWQRKLADWDAHPTANPGELYARQRAIDGMWDEFRRRETMKRQLLDQDIEEMKTILTVYEVSQEVLLTIGTGGIGALLTKGKRVVDGMKAASRLLRLAKGGAEVVGTGAVDASARLGFRTATDWRSGNVLNIDWGKEGANFFLDTLSGALQAGATRGSNRLIANWTRSGSAAAATATTAERLLAAPSWLERAGVRLLSQYGESITESGTRAFFETLYEQACAGRPIDYHEALAAALETSKATATDATGLATTVASSAGIASHRRHAAARTPKRPSADPSRDFSRSTEGGGHSPGSPRRSALLERERRTPALSVEELAKFRTEIRRSPVIGDRFVQKAGNGETRFEVAAVDQLGFAVLKDLSTGRTIKTRLVDRLDLRLEADLTPRRVEETRARVRKPVDNAYVRLIIHRATPGSDGDPQKSRRLEDDLANEAATYLNQTGVPAHVEEVGGRRKVVIEIPPSGTSRSLPWLSRLAYAQFNKRKTRVVFDPETAWSGTAGYHNASDGVIALEWNDLTNERPSHTVAHEGVHVKRSLAQDSPATDQSPLRLRILDPQFKLSEGYRSSRSGGGVDIVRTYGEGGHVVDEHHADRPADLRAARDGRVDPTFSEEMAQNDLRAIERAEDYLMEHFEGSVPIERFVMNSGQYDASLRLRDGTEFLFSTRQLPHVSPSARQVDADLLLDELMRVREDLNYGLEKFRAARKRSQPQ